MNHRRSSLVIVVLAGLLATGCGGGVGSAATGDPATGRPSTGVPDPPPAVVEAHTMAHHTIAKDGCPFVNADELGRVVTAAIAGLPDTVGPDGWSRACARVIGRAGAEDGWLVAIEVGWQGTIRDYAREAGAAPIADLANEAYALDAGRRIVIRSGELVALVSYAGATASATETLARLVAQQLPE